VETEFWAHDAWLALYEAHLLSGHVEERIGFKTIVDQGRVIPEMSVDPRQFTKWRNRAERLLVDLRTCVDEDLADCKERDAKLRAELEQFETKAGEDIFEFVLSGKVEAQT
jgi:hypothetical protein